MSIKKKIARCDEMLQHIKLIERVSVVGDGKYITMTTSEAKFFIKEARKGLRAEKKALRFTWSYPKYQTL